MIEISVVVNPQGQKPNLKIKRKLKCVEAPSDVVVVIILAQELTPTSGWLRPTLQITTPGLENQGRAFFFTGAGVFSMPGWVRWGFGSIPQSPCKER